MAVPNAKDTIAILLDANGVPLPQYRAGPFQGSGNFEALQGRRGGHLFSPNGTASLTSNPGYVTVDVGGAVLAPANTDRVLYRIVNTGLTAIEVYWSVNVGATAPAGQPVDVLPPGASSRDGYGGSHEESLWLGAIAVRSTPDAAGGEVLFVEI